MFIINTISIPSFLEPIYTLYESVLAKQPYALILNIVFFVAIIVCSYNIVRYSQDHNIFRKIVAKLKSDIKEQERLREEEYKKQFELEGQFQTKNRMQRLNKKLINSGITVSHPEFTAELFILIVLLTCIMVGFFMYFTYGTILNSAIGIAVTVFAWMLILEITIARNQNALEKETIKFVNLLKNFSHTEGSLAEMLGRTVPYIQNPLKTSVERCYYEIKTTGDTSLALQRLCDRTSYKKLKEVFDALRICSTHNEDYEGVINESCQSIGAYISYRKEIRQIKQSNIMDIFIMGGAGVLVIVEMRSMLIDIDVMYYLFDTLVGQCAIAALIIIFAYSIYNIIKDDEK